MVLIFFIGKYGPQKLRVSRTERLRSEKILYAMVGQNARSIPFLKYIVHKGFSGIELPKYRPKDGPIKDGHRKTIHL